MPQGIKYLAIPKTSSLFRGAKKSIKALELGLGELAAGDLYPNMC